MLITKPGIYENIPIEDYHSSSGLSSSGLSLLLDCPKKYWYEYLYCNKQLKEKKSFLLGSAIHCATLEPEKFEAEYKKFDGDKRKKADREEYEELKKQRKTILTFEEMVIAVNCSSSILNHPVIQRIDFKTGNVETSLAWEDEGVLLRSRPDFYSEQHRLIVDIKTTENASPMAFERSIYNYGYHRQAALAVDGLTALTGEKWSSVLLVAVEKTPPYLVGCYLLDQRALDMGRSEYKRGVNIYRNCIEKNVWPGYSEMIEPISIPAWVKDEIL